MLFSFKPKWIEHLCGRWLNFQCFATSIHDPDDQPLMWQWLVIIDVAMIIDYLLLIIDYLWLFMIIDYWLWLNFHCWLFTWWPLPYIAIYCHATSWLVNPMTFPRNLPWGSAAQRRAAGLCLIISFPWPGWWWLEPWNFDWLSICWEWNNDPNWQTPSFFRGVGIPPSRLPVGMADIDAGGQAYWEMLRDEHPFGQ